jgi:NDP-sugar pyrophosphorylase family protein
LLPALHERGEKVIVQNVTERVQRMRDLSSYLKAVRNSLIAAGAARDGVPAASLKRIAPTAAISSSAILDGYCIIEPDAVIEDGAVVHDSVVLSGAVVGGGAVVSRSVLGPTVRIKPRTQVVHDVIPTPSDRLGDVLELIENAAGVTAA